MESLEINLEIYLQMIEKYLETPFGEEKNTLKYQIITKATQELDITTKQNFQSHITQMALSQTGVYKFALYELNAWLYNAAQETLSLQEIGI